MRAFPIRSRFFSGTVNNAIELGSSKVIMIALEVMVTNINFTGSNDSLEIMSRNNTIIKAKGTKIKLAIRNRGFDKNNCDKVSTTIIITIQNQPNAIKRCTGALSLKNR